MSENGTMKKELERLSPMEEELLKKTRRVNELSAELSGKIKENNELDKRVKSTENARQSQRAKLEAVQDAMMEKTTQNMDSEEEIERLKMLLQQEQEEVIILTKNLTETEDELNKNIDENGVLTKTNEASFS